MVSSVSEFGVQAPVIEAILLDNTAKTEVSVRITRVASSAIASGGYILYRSRDRDGFGKGVRNDDENGFEQAGTLAQFSSTAVFADLTVSTQPDEGTLYYRARAADDTSTPTELSGWSNVVTFIEREDRRVPIPTFPSRLQANQGILQGFVDESVGFQDEPGAGGVSWYDLQQAMAAASAHIERSISNRYDEATLLELFIDPPAYLRQWFEHLAAAFLVPYIGLVDPERQSQASDYYHSRAKHFRDSLYSETIRPQGSAKAAQRWGRMSR